MCLLDLVKDDTGGLVDSEQANNGGEDGQAKHDLVVGNRQEEDIVVLNTVGLIAQLALDGEFAIAIAVAIDAVDTVGVLLELGARRADWLGGSHVRREGESIRGGDSRDIRGGRKCRPLNVDGSYDLVAGDVDDEGGERSSAPRKVRMVGEVFSRRSSGREVGKGINESREGKRWIKRPSFSKGE